MRVLSVYLFMNVCVVVVLFCVLQQIRMEQIDMRVLSVYLFMNVCVVVVLFCVLQQIRMEQIDMRSAQCDIYL